MAVQRPGGTWFGLGGGGGVARCPLSGRRVRHDSSALGMWNTQVTRTGGHLRTDEWQITHPGEDGLPGGPVRSLAPGKFAPMLVRMPGRWEYRFIWANGCLWIAKQTFSGPEREAQPACGWLINLAVNGQPVEGVPVVSDEAIRASEAQLAVAEERRRQDRERE